MTDTPPPKRRVQIHLSTAVALMIFAAGWLLLTLYLEQGLVKRMQYNQVGWQIIAAWRFSYWCLGVCLCCCIGYASERLIRRRSRP
jgi:hypothetical protein